MIRWLSRSGAQLVVADTRLDPPNQAWVSRLVMKEHVFYGPFKTDLLQGVDLVAVSPGIALADPLVRTALEQGIPVVGDIELFAQALRQFAPQETQVLAITGSNGKTTVTSMVGAMAKRAGLDVEVAGNIGQAALDALINRLDSGKWPQLWVLELSSFQLETTTSLQPAAATVLNLSEDHLDRYNSIEEYAVAKARIFSDSNGGGCVQILNREDKYVSAMVRDHCRQITFGLSTPTSEDAFGILQHGSKRWLTQGDKRLLRVKDLAVTGLHNVANALAALALCRAIELPFEPLLRTLRAFGGLPHRMQKISEFNGIAFYDDSKSTNVGSAVAALSGFGKNVILIAGGDGKGQDFSPLGAPVVGHARSVVLLGRDADRISQVIRTYDVPEHRVETMQEAVQVSFLLAEPGDVVLLSPACASLDMFDNYIHRAEVFTAAVREIEHKFISMTKTFQ